MKKRRKKAVGKVLFHNKKNDSNAKVGENKQRNKESDQARDERASSKGKTGTLKLAKKQRQSCTCPEVPDDANLIRNCIGWRAVGNLGVAFRTDDHERTQNIPPEAPTPACHYSDRCE